MKKQDVKAAEGSQYIKDKKYDLKGFISETTHPVSLKEIKDHRGRGLEEWQGVYDGKKERVVAVVNAGYNLLPNKLVLEPVLSFLDKQGVKHVMGNLTYASDVRMRLCLAFPEMQIKDDTKEGIISALYLHNSYNGLEAFKIVGGALRRVCANGMVVMDVVQRVRITHQADQVTPIAEKAMSKFMLALESSRSKIEQRIKRMMSQQVSAEQIKSVDRHFENSVVAQVLRESGLIGREDTAAKASEAAKKITDRRLRKITEWQVYNQLTEHISHRVPQRYRVQLLSGVGRIFEL